MTSRFLFARASQTFEIENDASIFASIRSNTIDMSCLMPHVPVNVLIDNTFSSTWRPTVALLNGEPDQTYCDTHGVSAGFFMWMFDLPTGYGNADMTYCCLPVYCLNEYKECFDALEKIGRKSIKSKLITNYTKKWLVAQERIYNVCKKIRSLRP